MTKAMVLGLVVTVGACAEPPELATSQQSLDGSHITHVYAKIDAAPAIYELLAPFDDTTTHKVHHPGTSNFDDITLLGPITGLRRHMAAAWRAGGMVEETRTGIAINLLGIDAVSGDLQIYSGVLDTFFPPMEAFDIATLVDLTPGGVGTCGDGVCGQFEDALSCPADCCLRFECDVIPQLP